MRWTLIPGALGLLAAGCITPGASGPSGLTQPPGTSAAAPLSPLAQLHGDSLPPAEAARISSVVARQLDAAGNDEGAREQWEKVAQNQPNNTEASRRLAILYDRKPDFSRAETEYLKLARVMSRDPDFLSDWGYHYYLRNNWDEAEAKFRQALQLHPKHARAHSNLGLVLGRKERYPEAFQEFRAAGLTDAQAHCNLAFVYWAKGRLEEAKQECRLAMHGDSSCENAREMLAQLEGEGKGTAVTTKGRAAHDRASASRSPSTRNPRAATLPPEAWETERQAALQAVAQGATGAPLTGMPPGAVSGAPVLRTSNGTAWIPVQPRGDRSGGFAPTGVGHGAFPGSVTLPE